MNTEENIDTYSTILRVLDGLKYTQLNIQSKPARDMLAREITVEVDKNIKQLVEAICCGG
tara:strand:+ start:2857 stop:3036 length:180 start_codon:yes stop_codon:yes gene_type:complete